MEALCFFFNLLLTFCPEKEIICTVRPQDVCINIKGDSVIWKINYRKDTA